jgi:hypothetical protein
MYMFLFYKFFYSVVKTESARRLLAAGVQVNYDLTLRNIELWDLQSITEKLSKNFGKMFRKYMYIHIYMHM